MGTGRRKWGLAAIFILDREGGCFSLFLGAARCARNKQFGVAIYFFESR